MEIVKPVSAQEIDHRIAQVNATLAIEGMPLTDEDKIVLERFAKGELSMNDVIEIAKRRI